VTTDQPHRFRARLAATLATLVALPAYLAITGPPAGAADSNSLTVKAGEYTYKLSGSPKSGLTQVTFQNDGTEYHMMAIVPLKKGVTLAQVKKAAASNDQSAFNAISGKGDASSLPQFLGPGEKETVLSKLSAGHYALLCFIPAPDGAPHLAHGMVKLLDVSSAKSSLTPPKDGLVPVTVTEDGITLPKSGVPKSGWVKVTNGSSTIRDLTVARFLTPNATFEDGDAYFNSFFETGKVPDGPAPAAIASGVATVPAGGTGYLQLNLKPGRYVFVSGNEEADDNTGEVHQEFTVK
jgi:hypothetical protein